MTFCLKKRWIINNENEWPAARCRFDAFQLRPHQADVSSCTACVSPIISPLSSISLSFTVVSNYKSFSASGKDSRRTQNRPGCSPHFRSQSIGHQHMAMAKLLCAPCNSRTVAAFLPNWLDRYIGERKIRPIFTTGCKKLYSQHMSIIKAYVCLLYIQSNLTHRLRKLCRNL